MPEGVEKNKDTTRINHTSETDSEMKEPGSSRGALDGSRRGEARWQQERQVAIQRRERRDARGGCLQRGGRTLDNRSVRSKNGGLPINRVTGE